MSMIHITLVLVLSVVIVITTGKPIIDERCGPVENFIVEETDTEFKLSWSAPSGPGCNGNYLFRIQIYINGDQNFNRFHAQFSFQIDKQSCSEFVFVVWSTVQNADLASSNIREYSTGIIGSGAVLNIKFENNRLEWNKPENSEGCNLEYEVVVDTKNLNPTKITVSEQSVELTLIPCSENTISVTSIVTDNGRRGEEANIEERGPVTSTPPIHESTNPKLTGAEVKWNKDTEENHCDFVRIKFDYFQIGTDNKMSVSFGISEYGSYVLENLTPDRRYSYRARWILENTEDGENSEISDYIEFQTTPLTDPHSIEFSIAMEGGIKITWKQEYEVYFITKHEIVVENLGPDHFLPEICQTDEGETMEFPQEPGKNFVIFPNARSNYNYRVTVTTLFENLGLNTSSEALITAPMEDPGFLNDIVSDHIYENGVQYAIKTNVTWTIPCDINGPVRYFDVKISGKLNADGVNGVCNIDFFTERISGNKQETFGVVTDVLVPFFDYNIIIITVLESENEKSSENRRGLSVVPEAYTPPNSK